MVLPILLMFLCFFWTTYATNTNFLQVPLDSISILDSTARFVCQISDQDNCLLIWRFTGNTEVPSINTNERTSVVTLDASTANNGTIVECGCRYSSIDIDYTTPVHLLVQGPLDPPSNLQSTSTATTILLSWDAPFTLDLTDITPDITGYRVRVENTNTGSLANFNVIAPPFAIVCEDFAHCNSLRLSVSGLNSYGEGSQSDVIVAQFLNTMIMPSSTTVPLQLKDSTTTEQPLFSSSVPTLNTVYSDGVSTSPFNETSLITSKTSTLFQENNTSVMSTTSSSVDTGTNTVLIIGMSYNMHS